MKVDYEELAGYYKAFRYGRPGDGEYEDAIESIVWLVPDILRERKELEAENADLKRQVTEAVSYILSNEGASMIDCRTCFFVSSCECEPKQCEPNYEMCLRAVRKYIAQDGE